MQEEKMREKLFHEQSCLKCFHFPVCYYFRAIAPIVTIEDEKLKQFQPFKAEEMARICKDYAPDAITA
ncbi:MAG: hypothetical protein JRN26_02995 [Nitrososphaerota archaeon]|jgi:hypothetical protein|nr:hypothetical protein [Nitrososphaerota archaeon]MDG6930066.1 hypothetical protein [Nitrososphaerota archaeon]MDG6931780.1 hypothetical protein [Nitrososphaerota archaeon]MDG6935841.1 hypothetical protein [Nitrososphaerota archaeon]MDG6944608.1 hypothetical protein [Nitrososphaerota archaeon]